MEGTTNHQADDTPAEDANEPQSTHRRDKGIERKPDRDYGDYRDNDEGDSSVRAGSYDKGRREPVQPTPHEQSGSTGRPTGNGDPAQQGADTGQGRYGQSGVAGTPHRETSGQKDYRESAADGDAKNKSRSNAGSGTVEHEHEEYSRNPGAQPPQREGKK